MKHIRLKAKRRTKIFYSEKSRVITRRHIPHPETRIINVIERVAELSEKEVKILLKKTINEFADRHRNLKKTLLKHYNSIERYIPDNIKISEEKALLLGAYFTMEYSVESAALFNPSIVLSPDQSNLPDKSIRFIMSFRATGEGHISSIEFRSGTLDDNNSIFFDPMSNYVAMPEKHKDRTYEKHLFQLKLDEMGALNETTLNILSRLQDHFTYESLIYTINDLKKENLSLHSHVKEAISIVKWLAKSNYEIIFDSSQNISERVIFPVSINESRGIEDARFVKFVDDDNKEETYYATYTAYNGEVILPQLIETKDFIKFNISTLNGKAVQNKGMALFPRKINGKYVMLSRQDGENNHIMFSDHLHFWQESTIIDEPLFPWEFMQIGNCGSPIETEKGWLFLTHGVGPMRKYCIGLKLLDTNNPEKVIGCIEEPIIVPNSMEREGYVPNVVYSCGALIHNNELIIPYAMSDSRSGIATLSVDDIFNAINFI